MKILWYIFLGFILYKLITSFIIPLVSTTRNMKKQMDEMQRRMREAAGQQNEQRAQAPKQEIVQEGEYIDYEEVK